MTNRLHRKRKWLALLLTVLLAGMTVQSPAFGEEVFQDIVVKPGETLWAIANRYLKDPKRWPDIVKYNNLQTSDPTVPLPGSKLKIPILLIKEEYRNAQLIKMIPEVRFKRKGTTDWAEAKQNMTLHYEDSLRTMKGAKAHIQFPTKEVVQINENTYVVVKPEKILQEIELHRGEVRARRARVIMPTGTVVKPKSVQSDYQAKVRDDETEVVFVYKGKVDVTAQGKTVTVREGFGTEVPKLKPPKEPQPLTSFDDFNPAEMTAAAVMEKLGGDHSVIDPSKSIPKAAAPKKVAKGKAESIASGQILVNYTLQLATDEKFTNIVFKTNKSMGTMFDVKKAKIPDGNYFMRVAFTDALGVTGPFSQPSPITRDTSPPVISNLFPKEGQKFNGEEKYCDVIGDVDGAAMLAINDEVVFVGPTGRFTKFLTLEEGPNKITVLARDLHGNETVVNRTVYYSK